jgi:tRNA threonylcarbamoyladenosine biosynthesis protein TsaE
LKFQISNLRFRKPQGGLPARSVPPFDKLTALSKVEGQAPDRGAQAGRTIKTLAEVVTHSPEDTVAFGHELAKELRPPCLALLEGELGTGKTTLVKGIVAGLGAAREEDVTSPSFTLVHEYGLPALRQARGSTLLPSTYAHGSTLLTVPERSRREDGERQSNRTVPERKSRGERSRAAQAGSAGKVYHVDLYRIEDARELATLGLEDLAEQDATVLVEWGEKLAGVLPVPPRAIRVRMEHLGSEDRRITVERLEA